MEATNRELRVFLSSTFRDMQAERDYLIKSVFPEIRSACRARHVQFTDIDLRWGLTREEAEQGKVVAICLDEIEKCRPYFIGFLGERYGWSPTDSDLSRKAELVARFPVVEHSLNEQLSVTEMEIRHGVLDNPDMATHSFFYFRTVDLSRKLREISRAAHNDYFESDDACYAKLHHLKANIRKSGLPLLDGYSSIQEFGDRVKQDLLKVLESRFPARSAPTLREVEQSAHEAYAESRCHAYVPDPDAIDTLNHWIADQSKNQSPLVITGSSGLGKSSLVAYWTTKTEHPANRHIVSHYVGSSSDPMPSRILGRLIEEIKETFAIEHPLPENHESVVTDFPEWLARIPSEKEVLLVIDGVNQIDVEHLYWLPTFWPANVRAVLTVTPGVLLDQCRERQWHIFESHPLTSSKRRNIIARFLAHYRKSLANEQVEILVRAPQTENPLYLRILLEELRVFGSFEELTTHLRSLLKSHNPSELYQLLLSRLEADLGKPQLQAMLSLIWGARKGLTESEILELTGMKRLDLSRLLGIFDFHLARKGGELNFFHDYLRQAVEARYLKSSSSPTKVHRRLATFFSTKPVDERTTEELPWQWFQAKSSGNLRTCLTRRDIFEGLYSRAPHDLTTFWAGCREKPGKTYRRTIKTWFADINSLDDLAVCSNKLAHFLSVHCADYAAAAYIANWAAKQVSQTDKHAACVILQTQGFTYRMQGKFAKARRAYESATSLAEGTPDLLSQIETANLLASVARLQRATGEQLEFAASRYEQALKLLAVESSTTKATLAITRAELAGVQKASGRFSAAVENYEAAAADLTKLYGKDYVDLADILNSLGDLWEDRPPTSKSTLEKAEAFYRQAQEIREHRLGINHPASAASMNNLARIAQKKGDLPGALKLAATALQIRRNCLSANHPDIATSLNQVARIKGKLGMFNEAEADYQHAIDICVVSFGEIHRRTLRNLEELSELLVKANKQNEANVLKYRVKKIREAALSARVTLSSSTI